MKRNENQPAAQVSLKSVSDSTALRIRVAELMGTLKPGKPKYEHRYGPGPMKVISRGPPQSPDYPSDLNAAIQLCDVLKEKGWVYYASNETGRHVVYFRRKEKGFRSYEGTGDTLSEVICRAFVAVMEQDLEEKEV